MAKHNEKGSKAEKVGEKYLVNRGYSILHKNWHYGHKEIDLVAEKNNRLIIVEIKGRIDKYYNGPSDVISIRKMKNLCDAAEAYINKFNIENEIQFDLIIVIFGRDENHIEHIEEVFYPGVNW